MERGRYVAMRYELDSINQLNRNSQPFTPADVQPYLDYFNRHGNSNDQMLAYYLLGRAYHERGEAPMALQYYQEAAGKVDTTSTDCDYAQLSRVYSQMADIFYNQNLLRQELTYDKLAERYAWKGKDTLAALMNMEQQCLSYKELGEIDTVVVLTENVARLYEQYGYLNQSAIALCATFRVLIKTGNYDKLRVYMTQYEKNSGFFDENGNIEKGREVYYNLKGTYYYQNQQYDSAEFYFRKELTDGKDFNNQNAGAYGLGMVYERLHQPDSAANYYRYAYAMNDSMYAQMATEDIERMQAMYDYTRHQEMAYAAMKKASYTERIVWLCIGAIVFIILIGIIVYERLHRKRKDLEYKYLQSLEIIRQARQDIAMLKENKAANANLIAEKERVIYEQKDYLKTLPIEMPIYKRLAIKGQKPTADEWLQIESQVFELYPQFHDFMKTHVDLLNDKEYKTCILIRAGFKPKSISSVLNVGASYISNIRSGMLQTLFGVDGSPKRFDETIRNMG